MPEENLLKVHMYTHHRISWLHIRTYMHGMHIYVRISVMFLWHICIVATYIHAVDVCYFPNLIVTIEGFIVL